MASSLGSKAGTGFGLLRAWVFDPAFFFPAEAVFLAIVDLRDVFFGILAPLKAVPFPPVEATIGK